MMKKLFVLSITVLFVFLINKKTNAQAELKKYSLYGYVSNVQSVMFQDIDGYWMNDNMLHNRLNFMWYPTDHISGTVQLRNRFMYGDQIKLDTSAVGYADGIDADNGLFDMSLNVFEEKSFLFNTNIDRLWFSYEKGNFNAKIGRQRINWGQCFVWNPNDIFNTYSFFDFDYPEKPGSDAIRLQYYTGFASSVELAVKADKDKNVTAAFLGRFNKWDYDFQFLGGVLNSEDMVIGAGWAGNIKGAGFRGEMTYLRPTDNFADTTGTFIASVSSEYMFSNSLMIQFEYLYHGLDTDITDFYSFYEGTLSVKKLSFTEHNIFGQVSYPITPLLNGTFSAMYYPEIDGYYLGPSFDYSLSDNLSATFFVQLFSGEFPDATGEVARQDFRLGFLRIKWNF